MPLRTRYGYNCQKVNFGKITNFLPLGYMEVIPGETIRGKITVDVHSAPTVRAINTRVYMDLYAFYTPYRLVFPEWPEFISGQVTPPTLPTVANTWEDNLEPRLTQGAGTPTSNLAFQRRTYNLVFNKFFRESDPQSPTLDANSLLQVYQRPSTFEVADPPRSIASTSITADTTVDDLRQSFATDQFNKMRQFYGDRYVDYLRAVGVQTGWQIQEEPEPIGKSHHDLPFRLVPNTTDSSTNEPLGYTAGYFKGKNVLDIRRTFTPEHGLIGAFLVVRCDPIYDTPACAPHLAHENLEDFWSPEFEATRERNYYTAVIEPPGASNALDVDRPAFEHLRKGLNENRDMTDLSPTNRQVLGMYTTSTVTNRPTAAEFDGNFDLTDMAGSRHYQATSDWRLTRNSPLIRHGQTKAIH